MTRYVSIPSSSGMGVGRKLVTGPEPKRGLNTFFIRYGCRTSVPVEQDERLCLNTFFIRYGCRTQLNLEGSVYALSQYLLHQVWVSDTGKSSRFWIWEVSIPSSSGMGVGPAISVGSGCAVSLNTFFIRYGCRTKSEGIRSDQTVSQYLLHQVWVSDIAGYDTIADKFVSIPSSSGMGVGRFVPAKTKSFLLGGLNTFFIRYGCRTGQIVVVREEGTSQYLLHQVWVSDKLLLRSCLLPRSLNTFFIRYGCRTRPRFAYCEFEGLNTFFIRYGCRTSNDTNFGLVSLSQYLLHQVWVSDLDTGKEEERDCLNTFFIRYGCRTRASWKEDRMVSLNTFFIRYGCRTVQVRSKDLFYSLNTFFIRYGCRTVTLTHLPNTTVSIPSSSGMGVGRFYGIKRKRHYRLNTFFIRYGCRTVEVVEEGCYGRLNTFFIRYGCRT